MTRTDAWILFASASAAEPHNGTPLAAARFADGLLSELDMRLKEGKLEPVSEESRCGHGTVGFCMYCARDVFNQISIATYTPRDRGY